ncbi:hypothetical protein [Flavobacterium sharifuzzamanii]|uniref:hypothetical protein n=1 Tax=Flavobacterium sharifuzzamanii TaxID=2211133 RepID=UPI000DAC757C|nr:hypothetical protein [Flavobacterium sharifuzzamanii]KAF2080129.1 hypothetical protein DMA14_17070 [Flavobacterium sharifuzzamanii]
MKYRYLGLLMLLISCAKDAKIAEAAIPADSHEELSSFISKNRLEQSYLYKSEFFGLERHTVLRDFKGRTVALETMNRDSLTLFYRFSGSHCTVCVEAELENIEKLPASKKSRIIFLASDLEARELQLLFSGNAEMKKNLFLLNEPISGFPMEDANVPYYFAVDKDFKANHLFFPDKAYPELTMQYLRILSNKI